MAKQLKIWDGTAWQSIANSLPALNEVNVSINSNITLDVQKRYFVNTSAARTLTLPSTAILGNEIVIIDATGSAGTNNITISRNDNLINGLSQDAIIDVNQDITTLIYTGSTLGWRLI